MSFQPQTLLKNPVFLVLGAVILLLAIGQIVLANKQTSLQKALVVATNQYNTISGETVLRAGPLTVNPTNNLITVVSSNYSQLSAITTLYSLQLSVKVPTTTNTDAVYSATFSLKAPIAFTKATCLAQGSVLGNQLFNIVGSLTSASSQTFTVTFSPNPQYLSSPHNLDVQIVASA